MYTIDPIVFLRTLHSPALKVSVDVEPRMNGTYVNAADAGATKAARATRRDDLSIVVEKKIVGIKVYGAHEFWRWSFTY